MTIIATLIFLLFLFQIIVVGSLVWLRKFYVDKLEILQSLRKSERKGRIAAEQKLANLSNTNYSQNQSNNSESNQFLNQVGVIETCYSQRNGTPRQPSLVPLAYGTLKLDKKIPGDTLEGLSQFSHCWLIYLFHQNTNMHKNNLDTPGYTFKSKIKVPRLQGQKLGVFSTRSPHRPNPVGLSLVKILKVDVENGVLLLSGLDLVNGTPILDIKPYVPFADSDVHAIVPKWVVRDMEKEGEPLAVKSVEFNSDFNNQLDDCWNQRGDFASEKIDRSDKKTNFDGYIGKSEFMDLVSQVLSRDIRSVYQRKNGALQEIYHVILEGLDVSYNFDNGRVNVIGVNISK